MRSQLHPSRLGLISYWLELFLGSNAVAVLRATLDQVNEFFELSDDRQRLLNAYRIGDDPSQLQYNRRHLGRYSSNLALNRQSCYTPMKPLFAGLR